MDMPVSYAFNASAEEAAAANYPQVRYFYVFPNRSHTPLREFLGASSRWASGLAAGAASSFSAACWFSARDVADGLRASEGAVPIGMIHSALGGTPIQDWQSAAAAAKCPPAQPPIYSGNSTLYNAMIAPMVLNGLRTALTIWVRAAVRVARARARARVKAPPPRFSSSPLPPPPRCPRPRRSFPAGSGRGKRAAKRRLRVPPRRAL